MSYSLDVNILLYASDRSSDRHDVARTFLESCATRPEVLCLTWPTLMAYLRIATHSSIFAVPLSPEEALRNIGALLALPHVRVISEQDGFLDLYTHVTAKISARGNLVPDAHVATILFQNGVRTLYSNDRDFRKFESLDVRDPFV
ncbi:MAG: PIN domain-containing protein [Acidobacteriaceae bacterium]|jgi:toxin-antitoxin system PIN domain toxin|nr:PIN domain-containing protein [Acidobacteriaceae bacterium]